MEEGWIIGADCSKLQQFFKCSLTQGNAAVSFACTFFGRCVQERKIGVKKVGKKVGKMNGKKKKSGTMATTAGRRSKPH